MSRQATFIPRQDRDAATFDNTYQTLGNSLPAPGIIVKIVNNSDTDIDVSIDGTTDHDIVTANGFVLYDIRTNHSSDDFFAFKASTQFYIKGAAAGIGKVYLVAIREVP